VKYIEDFNNVEGIVTPLVKVHLPTSPQKSSWLLTLVYSMSRKQNLKDHLGPLSMRQWNQ